MLPLLILLAGVIAVAFSIWKAITTISTSTTNDYFDELDSYSFFLFGGWVTIGAMVSMLMPFSSGLINGSIGTVVLFGGIYLSRRLVGWIAAKKAANKDSKANK